MLGVQFSFCPSKWNPGHEFKMWKGLRQGDPMTHFLFLVVVEGLNMPLKRARKLGKFIGFTLGREGEVEISMLQFTDDTLFFGEVTTQNVVTLKCILRCFELASGLKVNFFKSKLIGVAVEVHLYLTLQVIFSPIHLS